MSVWSKEIWRLIFLLTTVGVIGYLIGYPTEALLLTLTVYLIWHGINIYQLAKWLEKPSKLTAPRGRGIWAEIFDQNYRLHKKNRERKKKLASYIGRFKESTAAMPDATVVLNRKNQVEWLNKAAQEMLGLHPTLDIYQHINMLVPSKKLGKYLKNKDFSTPLEIAIPGATELFVSIRLVPYGKYQHLFIARDITRLKRLEQMRRDFVSNISHELRTPLTVIHGYLESMEDENDDVLKEWQPHIKLMMRQSVRMGNIVNDLLTLSRLENEDIQVEQLSEVSVPDLLRTIKDEAEILANSQNKKLSISIDYNEEIGLSGLQNELYSAFSNLIFNAVRYTPDGGEIHIRWYEKNKTAYFDVEDNGSGIAPEHIPRLTERFFRVDVGRSREVGGTGLGLAIVKYILERHQSYLSIQSQLGQGSVFSCHFPTKTIKIQPYNRVI